MNRNPIALTLAAVQLVQNQPRDSVGLAALLGISRQHARNILNMMDDEGLVSKKVEPHESRKGGRTYLYTWQHKPSQTGSESAPNMTATASSGSRASTPTATLKVTGTNAPYLSRGL